MNFKLLADQVGSFRARLAIACINQHKLELWICCLLHLHFIVLDVREGRSCRHCLASKLAQEIFYGIDRSLDVQIRQAMRSSWRTITSSVPSFHCLRFGWESDNHKTWNQCSNWAAQWFQFLLHAVHWAYTPPGHVTVITVAKLTMVMSSLC